MNRFYLTTAILVVILLAAGSEVFGQTRIRFAKGRTSATVSGTIGGGGERTYVLGARGGQQLSGTVSSRNRCVRFSYGETSFRRPTGAGDNLIFLSNRCSTRTRFTLRVSIY